VVCHVFAAIAELDRRLKQQLQQSTEQNASFVAPSTASCHFASRAEKTRAAHAGITCELSRPTPLPHGLRGNAGLLLLHVICYANHLVHVTQAVFEIQASLQDQTCCYLGLPSTRPCVVVEVPVVPVERSMRVVQCSRVQRIGRDGLCDWTRSRPERDELDARSVPAADTSE
jgi:hypothetical protein